MVQGVGKIGIVLVAGIAAQFLPRHSRAVDPPGPPVEVSRTANAPAEVRLRRQDNGHFYVHAMVNGQLVRFLVDTGATNVVLTMADADRVGIPVKTARMRVIGTGASGDVRGTTARLDSVEMEGRRVTNLNAMVADGLDISLLGQDYLTRIGTLQMAGETMVLR